MIRLLESHNALTPATSQHAMGATSTSTRRTKVGAGAHCMSIRRHQAIAGDRR